MVKTPHDTGWQPTRRELLAAAATATLGILSNPPRGRAQTTQPAGNASHVSSPVPPPWWLDDHRSRPSGKSRVIDIRSDSVLHASVVDRVIIGEMLDQGIQNLTGAASAERAWRAVLGPAERIVVKFNTVGAAVIKTNDALAPVLVERISAAGYAPENIALAEVPRFVTQELGAPEVARGWGKPIQLAGRPEPLAQYLYDADAVINVPFLKTHQIAGMSGCMKNLSHALIRHPARYHGNGCSPYVAQVVGSNAVASKLKLNIVNAIRLVANRGPDAREEDIVAWGGLLLGFDPLAVDTVGLSILAAERRRLGLSPQLRVRYLAAAARMGLGRWRPAEIDRTVLEAGK